jgi:predicted CopG family antitoxin
MVSLNLIMKSNKPNTSVSKTVSFDFDVYVKLVEMINEENSISMVLNDLLRKQLERIEKSKEVKS